MDLANSSTSPSPHVADSSLREMYSAVGRQAHGGQGDGASESPGSWGQSRGCSNPFGTGSVECSLAQTSEDFEYPMHEGRLAS